MLQREMKLLALGVTGWKQEPEVGSDGFTHHKRAEFGSFLGALVVILVIEIIPVHLLLSHFVSPVAAWILTALTVYSLFWILGDYHAFRLTVSRVTREGIELRVGMRFAADIRFDQIARLEKCKGHDTETGAVRALVHGEPNLRLDTVEPVVVTGPYGVKRRGTTLFLLLDEPERIVERVRELGGLEAGVAPA